MPLETATYISGLVASNPASSDGLNQADDHMRLIKAALQATLPGATGPLTTATGGLQSITDGSSTVPAFTFTSEPALGLYRVAANTMQCSGLLVGTVPMGGLMMFAGNAAPYGFFACDGQALSRTTFSQLFGAIGTIWGAGDGSTTFNLPSLNDRFIRHRDASGAAGPVGTLQAAQTAPHTHTGSGTTGNQNADHTHAYSGTTGNDSPDHTHTYTLSYNGGGHDTGGGSFSMIDSSTGTTTGGASTRHQHPFSGTTNGMSNNHAHAFSFTTSNGSADGTETRPLSATVLFCIRAF